MINSDFTDRYLKDFDLLAEAIYLCWYNSYSSTTKMIDEDKLKEQIRSYGFYPFEKRTVKELPLCFRAKLKFKTLTWVNDFTNTIAEDTLCESSELYMLAIKELKTSLFNLKTRANRIAYANVILRELDKSHVHNKSVENSKLNYRLKELFGYILNHNFIAEDNVTITSEDCKVYPIYDLTVRLINHFDFIDKLIELFLCFDICLIHLAEKAKCNLYLFRNQKIELSDENDSTINVYPKFNSSLSDDCLIKIMQYFCQKKLFDNANSDIWLFWFNRKHIKVPEPLNWQGTPSMLSNVIQHLCGESISNTIKTAFCTKEYVKPTKSKYEHSRTHKEIEQIITISKQKNNKNSDPISDLTLASI